MKSITFTCTFVRTFVRQDYHDDLKPVFAWLCCLGAFLICTNPLLAQRDGFTATFDGYSDGTTYGSAEVRNDVGDNIYWLGSQNSQIYNGNLRIRFEGGLSGVDGGISAASRINGDRVYTLEYRLKFDPGFEWKLGGKLPGLAGGDAPTGGAQTSDGNGFTTRYMWRENGRLVVYAYYLDKPASERYGENWDCDTYFETDRWYTLRQRVTMNTGSNADGRVEVWVDGVKKLDRQNLRLMSNGNIIDRVHFDSFMGGGTNDPSWAPSSTQFLRIDDMKCLKNDTSSPPEPTSGNVVFSARGISGTEQVEVRYNDQTVGSPITLSTEMKEYRVQVDNPSGNFKLAFINDNANRDVVLDWLQADGVLKEAEEQEVNTASWTQAGCGTGSFTQNMYCAGYVDFESFDHENSSESGTIVIRAKGSTGSERMRLQVDNQLVKSWDGVSTTAADYTYEGYTGGEVRVLFDNDGSDRNGQDRNLLIDYINVCGVEQPAEQATRSSDCGNTTDGFVWLWCDSSLSFGNVGCSSAGSASRGQFMPTTAISTLSSYPNPASGTLTVEGSSDYQAVLYDLEGRPVMRHDHLQGRSALDIAHLRPGIYLLRMQDALYQSSQRIIVE